MSELIEFGEKPGPGKYLIAGWQQWADAGTISSGLPPFLVELTQAKKIGEIKFNDFYLFQIPGMHHLLRPVVHLDEGHNEGLSQKRNEFFYSHDEDLLIFAGEEPHHNEKRYAEAFFDAVEELGIQRVAAVAGVYGSVPYDRDREISCVYSLPQMKEELTGYSVKFSNYDGGATISMYLAAEAEARDIEFFRFCAFVPSYDFSRDDIPVHPIAIGEDFKAWYDIMLRLKHMFRLPLDLSVLKTQSEELMAEWDVKVDHVATAMPQLEVKEYMENLGQEFVERSFLPLSNVWEEELKNILDDMF